MTKLPRYRRNDEPPLIVPSLEVTEAWVKAVEAEAKASIDLMAQQAKEVRDVVDQGWALIHQLEAM